MYVLQDGDAHIRWNKTGEENEGWMRGAKREGSELHNTRCTRKRGEAKTQQEEMDLFVGDHGILVTDGRQGLF